MLSHLTAFAGCVCSPYQIYQEATRKDRSVITHCQCITRGDQVVQESLSSLQSFKDCSIAVNSVFWWSTVRYQCSFVGKLLQYFRIVKAAGEGVGYKLLFKQSRVLQGNHHSWDLLSKQLMASEKWVELRKGRASMSMQMMLRHISS